MSSRLHRKFKQQILKGKGEFPTQWIIAQEGEKEGISLSYQAGKISATAMSISNAVYGVNRLHLGMASGYLPDMLGEVSPHFSLRPLWLGSDQKSFYNQHLEIAFPSFILEDSLLENICERAVELGFNALMFGKREGMGASPNEKKIDWSHIGHLIHEYRLKLILKVTIVDPFSPFCSPVNESYTHLIHEKIQGFLSANPVFDFLFWESELGHPYYVQDEKAEEFTLRELVVKELQLLERIVKDKADLIFYIPASDIGVAEGQAEWLLSLCDEASKGTVVAFPMVAADPTHDHAPLHPFWDRLRKEQFSSSTTLLPILNVGAVRQGEGLWPSLSLDLIEAFKTRANRHHFAGAISLVNHFPDKGTLLECSLWVVSAILWGNPSPGSIAEAWFAAYHPEWNYPRISDDFQTIRRIIVKLSLLKSLTSELGRDEISTAEGRALSESLLAQVKELEAKWIKMSGEATTLHDYFLYFARDARRIILYFLQCFNISIPNVLNHEDLQESFWTSFSSSGGQGIRSGKVSFLDQPNTGQAGTRMNRLLLETRLIKNKI